MFDQLTKFLFSFVELCNKTKFIWITMYLDLSSFTTERFLPENNFAHKFIMKIYLHMQKISFQT